MNGFPKLPDDSKAQLSVADTLCECGCGQLAILVQSRGMFDDVSETVISMTREQAFRFAEMITRPFVMHSIDDLLAEIKTTETIERARKGGSNG